MTRPSILLTRRWPAAVEAYLRDRFDLHLNEGDAPLTADALKEAMLSFDALCPTVSDRIGADILAVPGRRARILANFGAGTDHIDLAAAAAAGLVVCNTPDAVTDATAEIALLLMLMASRRAGEGERELRSGRWTGWRPTHLNGQSLSGKLLGLVGFGRIGQATAALARNALGMRIAYHSRTRLSPAREQLLGAVHYPSVTELAEHADVLSLHCPGGPATRHLVDRGLLARMKPSAILINTARGSVVDEVALAEALAAGRLAAAGLDVYEDEPRVAPALLALDTVVLLPHLGSATRETRTAMGMRAAVNLESFFAGEAPRDRVV
jgi:lactate dehydrogenase-like 2-hydroxyacid dehydrogenase